jgi:hypothetical protein
MAAVQQACRPVSLTSSSSTATSSTASFYDCQGRSAQLVAAGRTA